MKKNILIIIIIIMCITISFMLLNQGANSFRFNTSFEVKSNGTYKEVLTTKEFILEAKQMSLEDKITSSSKYSVTMKLSKWDLMRIILKPKMHKYYDSFDNVRNLTKGAFMDSEGTMS